MNEWKTFQCWKIESLSEPKITVTNKTVESLTTTPKSTITVNTFHIVSMIQLQRFWIWQVFLATILQDYNISS